HRHREGDDEPDRHRDHRELHVLEQQVQDLRAIVCDPLPAADSQQAERRPVHERISRERSEEHTSELQSRGQLVCRLLLEKKYDALGQYFSELGFYKRILSVSDVDIKQAEDGAQEAGRSINSSFVVTAFYISPENLEKLTA